MKTPHNLINYAALTLGSLALILVLTGGTKEISLIQENSVDRTISVSGTAEDFVAPDTARISFSMTRKNANLSQATDSVNRRVAEMVDSLGQYGVQEQDMKTTAYSVYPEYTYDSQSGERSFDGYRVNQSLELVIRALDQVGPVLSAVGEFKVDNVSGLSFYVEDDEQIRDDLRHQAIKDAQGKARALAKQLGVSLDTIVGFHEGGRGYYPQPMFRQEVSFADASFEVAEASVPAGQNSYRAEVELVFELK